MTIILCSYVLNLIFAFLYRLSALMSVNYRMCGYYLPTAPGSMFLYTEGELKIDNYLKQYYVNK